MSLLDDFRKIRCFGFDVDGVLTDGSLLLLDDGQMVRTMNTKDGYAMQLAVKRGYSIVIISGGGAEGARQRLEKLGINAIYFQATDKKALLENYLSAHHILPEEVLFMGDDIPDLDAMKLCGIPCCPADAAGEVRQLSRYIALLPGGRGCVREVIEKVLKLNGHWSNDTSVASK
jgi:3-deoxy-D-manno-octulosonate 8-phosphate phosphatase (KDO 8-P phosphatase)